MNFFPKGSVKSQDPIASGCSRSARTEVFPIAVERLCCWSSRQVATNQDMTLAKITTQKIMHYIINYIMDYIIMYSSCTQCTHHVLICFGQIVFPVARSGRRAIGCWFHPIPMTGAPCWSGAGCRFGWNFSVCSEATKVTVEMTSEFLKLLKVLVFVSCVSQCFTMFHKTILDDPLSSSCNYCNLSGWYINRCSIQ